MPGPSFTYTGYETLGYPSYCDTDTGRMLIAEPGGSYGIRAVEEGHPVPPADGRWAAGGPPPPPPPPSPPLPLPVPPPPAPPAAEEKAAGD